MKKTARIAFQGYLGANSDIACQNTYPHMERLPCVTFANLLEAVKDGAADLGMVPIENTLAGRVADIHQLLPDSGLHIVGEYFLPIHFYLMGLPDATIEDITTVHSHVHALGQCRNIVRQYNWKTNIASDTAGAAQWVSQTKDITQAAFAPKLSAKLYGLKILAEHVEDATHNTTRFAIVAREPAWPDPQNFSKPILTSLLFRVSNQPAALYKALGGFATNGVNMFKLESYQLGGSFQATQFFADIAGHPDHQGVARALNELSFFCSEYRIIGVYPAALERFTSKTVIE